MKIGPIKAERLLAAIHGAERMVGADAYLAVILPDGNYARSFEIEVDDAGDSRGILLHVGPTPKEIP